MDTERKWYLAARFLTDSLTAAEKADWDILLQQDEAFNEQFKQVAEHWRTAKTLPYHTITSLDPQADWQVVLARIRHEGFGAPRAVPPTSSRAWLKYAAVLLIGITVGLAGWYAVHVTLYTAPTASLMHVEAPAGSKTFVTLPDGSTVWLNARSKLSFENSFGHKHRSLTLEGEAFFDVVKSTTPFEVHTSRYDIAVLGTAFNVSAYPDDLQSVTTLVRGSLKIIPNNTTEGQPKEILLKPREKYRIAEQPTVSTVDSATGPAYTQHAKKAPAVETNVDVETETAWKDDWLIMRGETLEALSHRMERLYNITITFSDASLKDYRYTGRIRQLSLEQVLRALALTSPVKFTINEQQVVFSENKKTKSKYTESLQTTGP